MIKLRPHHLLCFQSYIGKGYSCEFADNMDLIARELKDNPENKVMIVKGKDDVCIKCPNLKSNLCIDADKVDKIDLGVLSHLGIIYKEYSYKSLVKSIYTNISKSDFDKICSNCEWYEEGMCKDILRSKLK